MNEFSLSLFFTCKFYWMLDSPEGIFSSGLGSIWIHDEADLTGLGKAGVGWAGPGKDSSKTTLGISKKQFFEGRMAFGV